MNKKQIDKIKVILKRNALNAKLQTVTVENLKHYCICGGLIIYKVRFNISEMVRFFTIEVVK